jgi:hypothetical protein
MGCVAAHLVDEPRCAVVRDVTRPKTTGEAPRRPGEEIEMELSLRGWMRAGFAAVMMIATGCAATDDNVEAQVSEEALCEQASDKLVSCLGDEVQAPLSCNGAAARQVLDQSCEELTQGSQGQGKADAICNPLLWWTWASCGSSSSSATNNSRSLWVRLNKCSDNFYGVQVDYCDPTIIYGGNTCTLVTIETPSGQEVARGYTNNNSNVLFEDVKLDSGDYLVRVWRRDGTQAEMMTSSPGSLSYNRRVEATQPLKVGSQRKLDNVVFYFMPDESEQLVGCSRASGTVASTCNGQPMTPERTEWSWFVRVQGTNDAGDYTSLTRPFKTMDTNSFYINGLMPGNYELSFLEMNIPSFEQRNNPDYARLASRYATGRRLTDELVVSSEDIPNAIAVGDYELDHTRCR